ncbi:MAG: class I SAM-dependent methyltransferase [Mycobacterium sp.]|nr:class I SAM-dependent methyltransferase [Mycobacterium sp.]
MNSQKSGRRDGDSWDLGSGVGATATAVAASRAVAHRADLIDDPWAEPLVTAVGIEHFSAILAGSAPGDGSDVERMAHGMAVRTRYFDDFLSDATSTGIRQVVILASGLDARAYRLPWPADTVVFDVDQPGVIDFKVATLAGLGAQPTAEVRNAGVDLRDDWPAALHANGFDVAKPTAWIAEGLLIYLPPEAQDRLFDHISALSRPGSRLATEYMPTMDAFAGASGDDDEPGEDRWRRLGFQDDLAGLVYTGERSHVIDYLEGLGWEVHGSLVQDLFAANGLAQPDDEMTKNFAGFQYIAATLTRAVDRGSR